MVYLAMDFVGGTGGRGKLYNIKIKMRNFSIVYIFPL